MSPRFQKMNLAPTVLVKFEELFLVIYMDGKCTNACKITAIEKRKNGFVFYWFQAPLNFCGIEN